MVGWAFIVAGPLLSFGAAGSIRLIERNSHWTVSLGFLRDQALLLNLACCFAAEFPIAEPGGRDMLLQQAEVQYVCRNAARQSQGQSIRGITLGC
jgi:hypothetical protein